MSDFPEWVTPEYVERMEDSMSSMADYIDDLERQLADAREELDRLNHTFDLRWDSDMRAIQKWAAAHPERGDEWPGHSDLCVWLIAELERVKAERDELRGLSNCWTREEIEEAKERAKERAKRLNPEADDE